jgi:hypothetical protein
LLPDSPERHWTNSKRRICPEVGTLPVKKNWTKHEFQNTKISVTEIKKSKTFKSS